MLQSQRMQVNHSLFVHSCLNQEGMKNIGEQKTKCYGLCTSHLYRIKHKNVESSFCTYSNKRYSSR